MNYAAKLFRKSLLIVFPAIIPFSAIGVFGQISDKDELFLERVESVTRKIASRSYPEIKLKKLRFKTFQSRSSFFKARFSIGRFITLRKMRHIVYANPRGNDVGIPEPALEGVIAHELAHISYYTEKNRFQLLGLVSLASKGFNTRFERKADLEAIIRGYGAELAAYREWLYRNLDDNYVEVKKRDYFTPEEIRELMRGLEQDPGMGEMWKREVPLSIDDIRKTIERHEGKTDSGA